MKRFLCTFWLAAASLISLAQAGQIVIGQVAPLSGVDASQGRAYGIGMQLCFALANKAGVNGNTFTLVRKDDAGKPVETVALTRQLIAESRPVALAGYFGNRNVDELVSSGILQAERLALVGYRVSEIRPDTPQLYSVRAGLREEINKFADQASTVGMTRLALVYEESAGAPALLAVAQEAAARSKASLTKASYPAGTARMAAAVATMQAASPQAIFIVGSGTVVAGFIEQYRGGGGAAQLFAPSGADIEQMSKRLGDEQMQGVSIAQVTPNPYQVRTRLAKELSDALSATTGVDVPVSYTMMEGFIACKVIVEAVRRQGVRVTREGMAPALDSMNGYDLGGYIVSYKPGSRTGSRLVELTIITASGKIRQ